MYKARDIALKVLAGAMGVERRKRFEQEAGLISQLNHPHVRAVHDIGEHEGGLYIALKFLEGEALGQRLVRGPLPVSETLRFGAQIADALAQAHRKSVTQCDLKPANIILVRSGGVVSAKLLDFGRASASADRAIGAGAVGRSGGLTHRHFFVRAGGAGDGDGRSGVSRGDARGADRPVRRRCGHCAQDLATQLNGLSEPVSAPSGALAAAFPAAGRGARRFGACLLKRENAEGDKTPIPYLRNGSTNSSARLSPDGRWLAYLCHDTSGSSLFVQGFPKPGRRRLMDTGTHINSVLAWSGKGDEIMWTVVGGRSVSVATVRASGKNEQATVAIGPPGVVHRMGPSTNANNTVIGRWATGYVYSSYQQFAYSDLWSGMIVLSNWRGK